MKKINTKSNTKKKERKGMIKISAPKSEPEELKEKPIRLTEGFKNDIWKAFNT